MAAKKLRRSLKWTADRLEDISSSSQAFAEIVEAEMGFDENGIAVALEADVIGDVGAYSIYPWTAGLEPVQVVSFLPGPYKIRSYRGAVRGVATNKPPTGPYRGVGRPISTFVAERLMDMGARALGIDPLEIRRRNLVRADEFPYRIASGIIWDKTGFVECLEAAVQAGEYQNLRKQQSVARAEGRYFGIGLASYAELTGIGSRIAVAPGMPINTGSETAKIRIDSTGAITAAFGVASHGQGLETTLAQIIADDLGARFEDIRVVQGDSDGVPMSTGTYASRSAVLGGGAAKHASQILREKIKKVASHLLEASAEDIEVSGGIATVTGTDRTVTFKQIAKAVYSDMKTLPVEARQELEGSYTYDPINGTTACATHLVAVEVDPTTCFVKINKYVVAEDCGRIINPMIVDGQVHGGVAQGIGAALYEEMIYDEDGQLVSASLVDYVIPSAVDIPQIDVVHIESESAVAGGFRGMGEGGTIGAPAAIANAIADALSALDIKVSILPMTPERLFRLLEPARTQAKGSKSMNSLAGRVALVTGGGRDVGAGISLALAEAGATVAVNYHSSSDEAEAVVDKIKKAGGKAKAYGADIADLEAVRSHGRGRQVRFRRPGYSRQQCRSRAAQTLQRNHTGRLAQADRHLPLWCDPLLPRRRAAARGIGPRPDHFHHGRFLPRRRIRPRDRSRGEGGNHRADEVAGARNGPHRDDGKLDCAWPNRVWRMTRRWVEANREKLVKAYPIRRLGQPSDVAPMVALLASDAGSWITGQVISISGGFSMV